MKLQRNKAPGWHTHIECQSVSDLLQGTRHGSVACHCDVRSVLEECHGAEPRVAGRPRSGASRKAALSQGAGKSCIETLRIFARTCPGVMLSAVPHF